jgi:type I restriction-modification system DNA methylase subunit
MATFNSILTEIRNILRKDGITNMDSVNHCVAFYILRIMDEALCEKLDIPTKFVFKNFDKDENDKPLDSANLFAKFYTPSNLEDEQNKDKPEEEHNYCFVYYLMNVFNMNEIGEYKLKKVNSFVYIYEQLKKINLEDLTNTYDVVGLIYENHLATGSTSARDLGQFFTHRLVIKFMIELCEPKLKANGEIESIIDPTMGTGGFLTMAAKYLNKKYPSLDWKLNSKFMYGCDIDDRLKTLSTLNMLLETGEIMPNLVNLDTLHNGFRFQDTVYEKFDIILANEPFGLKNIIYKEICERIKELKINGTKAEPLFLQLMMISLKAGGRCAVVIPDGVLFNDAKLHTETRKYLIEKLNLKKVISLEGDFFMNTGVKSSILYFVNDGTTTETEFSKIKLVGDRIAEETIKKVKKEDLVKAGYSLFLNKFIESRERKLEGIEYKKLGSLCKILNGYAFKSTDYTENDNNSIKIITIKNIDNYVSLNNCDIIKANEKYSKYIVKKNDILISLTGNIKIGIYNHEEIVYLNQRVIKLFNFDNEITKKYVYYFMKLNSIAKLQNNAKGSIQGNISSAEVLDLEIPIPPLELQQQIISILDADHAVIAANKKLIEMYETRKKGIIYANTLTLPLQKLNSIANINTSNIDKSFNHARIKYIDIGCINKGVLLKDEIKEYGLTELPCRAKRIIKLNDILLSTVRPNLENYLYIDNSNYTDNTIVSTGFAVISATKINPKYLYYIITTENTTKYLVANAVGASYPAVNNDTILNIEIPVPSTEIQAQIVAQCESIDLLIATLTKEIETIESSNVLNKMLEAITITEDVDSSNPAATDASAVNTDAVEPVVASATLAKQTATITKRKLNSAPIIKKTDTAIIEPVITE